MVKVPPGGETALPAIFDATVQNDYQMGRGRYAPVSLVPSSSVAAGLTVEKAAEMLRAVPHVTAVGGTYSYERPGRDGKSIISSLKE